MNRTLSVFLGTLSFAALPAYAADGCKLEKYGELPITMLGTRPIVEGKLNGAPAKFILDSGDFFNTLTNEAARKYQIKLTPSPPGFYMHGIGGAENVSFGNARDFALTGFVGGQVFHDIKFMVLEKSDLGNGVAGLIGQNTIGQDDTEYDLANGVVRLFRSKGCGDHSLAYWHGSAPIGVIKIENRTREVPNIYGQALLNGKKIRVMFDTGAFHSTLTLAAAARAGIKPNDESARAAGVMRGIGSKGAETSIARFDELDLGGEVIKNAQLQVADMSFSFSTDMLLGADFFLSHRVYLAEKQHKIYFTYNGGRVFDLGGKAPAVAAATTASEQPAATSEAAAAVPSLTATEYLRRGAASSGRRDFQSAIADFDAAIKLDPANAESYYERAKAKRLDRQVPAALADLDEALKLNPNYVPALVDRGSFRLARNNLAGARSDFDAAINAAPNDSDLKLSIARTYISMRHYEEAIADLNSWIAAHPKDARLSAALNDRCRSRTIIGKELDLALADCNGAIKNDSKTSQLLDSRGLVYLRRGDLDKSIDDFKASLKLQPKNPTTLYGLGVAQSKRGAKGEGDKNIQAALAINPTMAEFFKRLELTP